MSSMMNNIDTIDEFSDLFDDHDPSFDNTFSFDEIEGSPAATNENLSSDSDPCSETDDNDPFSSSEVSNISSENFPKFTVPTLNSPSIDCSTSTSKQTVPKMPQTTHGMQTPAQLQPFMFGSNPAAFAAQMNALAIVQKNLKMGIGTNTSMSSTSSSTTSIHQQLAPMPAGGGFIDMPKCREGGEVRKRRGEDKEERARKNREAADKSRRKKKELLETLPAKNAALESKVLELEKGLAASQAQVSALREQCDFLKQLLMSSNGKSNEGVGNKRINPSLDDQSADIETTSKLLKSSFSTMFDLNSGVGGAPTTGTTVMLAVCCVITFNQFDLLFGDLSQSEDQGRDMNHKGRVLLSTEEQEESISFFQSMFQRNSTSGRSSGGLLPTPVVFIALTVSAVMCCLYLLPYFIWVLSQVFSTPLRKMLSVFNSHHLPHVQKPHSN